mmetsp:Transcript_20926/g.30821  ORF Transcript_20926/g.30821 Transcript_20926/m.30821 type:complete len:487 (+) Transcript_20926:95-1555(+)
MEDFATLTNVCGLLFRPRDSKSATKASTRACLPLVGPVRITSSNVVCGRGLVATRDILPGECLFAIRPAVSAPSSEVSRTWRRGGGRKTVEELAEVILLKRIKRAVKAGGPTAESVLSQAGGKHSDCEEVGTTDIDVVLGRPTAAAQSESATNGSVPSNDYLLSIVHRNAFGPDYRSYDSLTSYWGASREEDPNPYGRVLGLYPLAAMINHSCAPNAVRVYSCGNNFTGGSESDSNELMIVHASQPIREGEEIVWSYVPTSRPQPERRSALKQRFGFDCLCPRCVKELDALGDRENNTVALVPGLSQFLENTIARSNVPSADLSTLPPPLAFRSLITKLEERITDKRLDGQTQRFLRLGCSSLYVNYFNKALSSPITEEVERDALTLAASLHLSFASTDHGSTEHLSILHLCYDLSQQQQRQGNDQSGQNGSVSKSKFWADQLRRAHERRYGILGKDLEQVREAMIHSKGVLRRMGGFEMAKYCFI